MTTVFTTARSSRARSPGQDLDVDPVVAVVVDDDLEQAGDVEPTVGGVMAEPPPARVVEGSDVLDGGGACRRERRQRGFECRHLRLVGARGLGPCPGRGAL